MLSPDRILRAIEAVVEAIVGPRLDYLALYRATVVSQNADTGKLQLLPDNPKLRGEGAIEVSMRQGLPGFTATVAEGARALVGFEAGNPNEPYFAGWDDACEVEEVVFDGGDAPVARKGDGTLSGYLVFDPTILTLYWAPAVDGVPTIYLPVAAPAIPGTPPSAGYLGTPVRGAITGGNEKLLA